MPAAAFLSSYRFYVHTWDSSGSEATRSISSPGAILMPSSVGQEQ